MQIKIQGAGLATLMLVGKGLLVNEDDTPKPGAGGSVVQSAPQPQAGGALLSAEGQTDEPPAN